MATVQPQTASAAADDDKYQCLPSTETCILHLRLLTALCLLRRRQTSSPAKGDLNDLQDCVEDDRQTREWTIFVAHAVARFERWLTCCVRRASPVTCSDYASSRVKPFDEPSTAVDWTTTTAPPLDVLAVLHSYMLSPRAFLQDCLRMGLADLWRAGFPWTYVDKYLSPVTFSYDAPAEHRNAYEQTTGDRWEPELSATTLITCPDCHGDIPAQWRQLYSGDVSQMDKGNTQMPFEFECPGCHSHVTQTSLCLERLKKDLRMLLEENVPLPGTLLANNGQVVQEPAERRSPIALNAAILTRLKEEGSTELLHAWLTEDPSKPVSGLASHLKGDGSFERQARRVDAVYRNNHSPFALDLVGAVIRQGAFVEKMREFAWLDSPARRQHAAHAIARYTAFFDVMHAYPGRVAVPTFDVDLVWHTHQLAPAAYYAFSTAHCGGVFIDHDDKLGDGLLADSFEWTCRAYAEVTGGATYDICLCWCCALLEAEYMSGSRRKTRVRKKLKALFSKSSTPRSIRELSPAQQAVMQVQLNCFEKDYAREIEEQQTHQHDVGGGGGSDRILSKEDYFETYIWHYPQFAPSPDMACRQS